MRLSSILTKILMAITGAGWFLYLVEHLAANLLMLKGPDALNGYAATMLGFGPILWVAEAGLVVLLAVHVYSAFRVTRMNKAARPERYQIGATRGQATLASRTMFIGGLVLLLFIPTHVWMFKYGDWSGPDGLWGLVVRSFHNPLISGAYVVAMAALGLHLSHGLGSAFQTLGVFKPSWRAFLREAGFVVGWAMAFGFAALPIWAWLFTR